MRLATLAALLATAPAACAAPTPLDSDPRPPAALETSTDPEPASTPQAPAAPDDSAATVPEDESYSVVFISDHLRRPPKPIKIGASGGFRHDASMAVFPEKVGDLERTDITQYDVDGRDISVSYRRTALGGLVAISIYVYPGPRMTPTDAPAGVVAMARDLQAKQLLEKELETILKRYDEHGQNGVVISQGPTTAHSGGVEHAGSLVVLDIDDAFGMRGRKGTSLLHYFPWVARDWQIKVRTTIPRGSSATEEVDRLLAAVGWPPEPL